MMAVRNVTDGFAVYQLLELVKADYWIEIPFKHGYGSVQVGLLPVYFKKLRKGAQRRADFPGITDALLPPIRAARTVKELLENSKNFFHPGTACAAIHEIDAEYGGGFMCSSPVFLREDADNGPAAWFHASPHSEDCPAIAPEKLKRGRGRPCKERQAAA